MTRSQFTSGIAELRVLVHMAGWSREDALDGFDALQTLRILQACRALDLETLPDQLTHTELRYAARHGKVSLKALERLYTVEYGRAFKRTGLDWQTR